MGKIKQHLGCIIWVTDLEDGQSDGNGRYRYQVSFYPFFARAKTTSVIDDLCVVSRLRANKFSVAFFNLDIYKVSTYIIDSTNVVAALDVLDEFVDFRFAARKRHPASLARPHRFRRAVEVNVLVPVVGAIDTAALKLLNGKK